MKDKILRKISKVDYLREILLRHRTEYKKILEIITKRNLTHKRGIGFWSLTRMIFPVIETVADVVEKEKEKFLSEELGVPFGFVVWEMYRNSLMHTDELRYIVYKRKTIFWSIQLGNEDIGHLITKQTDSMYAAIHLSIPKLYRDLETFLISEISKNDKSIINVQVGSYFSKKSKGILLKELKEIHSKY